MALSLLIFDCDGVILESVDAKTQAFAKIGARFGQEAADRLVMYHTMHGGVSRYEKFAWLFTEFLGRPIEKEEQEELNGLFVQYSLDAVLHCQDVPGIRDVLERWKGRVPMYVASGAPHNELGKILAERGLADFFDGIYGAPPGKTALLRLILEKTGLPAGETVMIGDSSTDQYAAEAVGAAFYGRGAYFKNSGYPWYDDLSRLNEYLEELFLDS